MRDLRGVMKIFPLFEVKNFEAGDAVSIVSEQENKILRKNVLVYNVDRNGIQVCDVIGNIRSYSYDDYEKTWAMSNISNSKNSLLQDYLYEEAIYRVDETLELLPRNNPDLVEQVAAGFYESSESILDGDKLDDICRAYA